LALFCHAPLVSCQVPAPPAIYTLSLHDALPIFNQGPANLSYIIAMLQTALPQARICSLDVRYLDNVFAGDAVEAGATIVAVGAEDRKSTRLNSSHRTISYAVFCLKKKKKNNAIR